MRCLVNGSQISPGSFIKDTTKLIDAFSLNFASFPFSNTHTLLTAFLQPLYNYLNMFCALCSLDWLGRGLGLGLGLGLMGYELGPKALGLWASSGGNWPAPNQKPTRRRKIMCHNPALTSRGHVGCFCWRATGSASWRAPHIPLCEICFAAVTSRDHVCKRQSDIRHASCPWPSPNCHSH